MVANNGGIYAGAIASGIYTTNGTEASKYIVEHSDSSVVFVENVAQLKKFDSVRNDLPKVKAYVCWDKSFQSDVANKNYSWADFMKLGEEVTDEQLKERTESQKPGHCCTLIYTSGTTGNPKAVMISHDNLTWTARVAIDALGVKENDRLISYLPLSHIAAQILDIHGSVAAGYCVYFAQPDALRGSLGATLKDVKPTLFLGVPRVWEKLMDAMKAVGAKNTGLKKKIAEWAKCKGLAGGYAEQEGKSKPWGYSFARKLVFDKVKVNLGLDQCRIHATSAAPISKETLEYFLSLGIPIMEIFGMSECTGPQTMSYPNRYQTGSCGVSMDGTELQIVNPDPKDKSGEIIFRGRNRFMGYYKNPEATAETIDEQGFLHSGDVGTVDEKGFLRITGRIKELIITAGGENIPPVLIENTIKEEIPILSNAVVIGDRRKFLTALFTLKTVPDAQTGHPSRQLTPMVISALEAIGSSAKTTDEAAKDPKVIEHLQKGLNKANERAISRAQRIVKFVVLEDDFSLDGGELTATMKLKRKVVAEKYSAQIEALYTGGEEEASAAPKPAAAAAEKSAAPAAPVVAAAAAPAAESSAPATTDSPKSENTAPEAASAAPTTEEAKPVEAAPAAAVEQEAKPVEDVKPVEAAPAAAAEQAAPVEAAQATEESKAVEAAAPEAAAPTPAPEAAPAN
jgi:long-chain-fatty-acid--CoA ligase ACSBG